MCLFCVGTVRPQVNYHVITSQFFVCGKIKELILSGFTVFIVNLPGVHGPEETLVTI